MSKTTEERPRLLVGPSLSTLTPAQLEELAHLAKSNISLDECEGDHNEGGDEGRSLHPTLKFIFTTKDACDEDDGVERVKYWGWEGGMTDLGEEWDTYEWTILAGEIIGPMGDCWDVLPIVKWFLDHGWAWRPTQP